MLKSLYSDSLPSHIVPSHFYDHFVRSSFDLVVDVSKTSNGFKTLHGKLSSHIKKQVGVDLPPFPRLNNSPVSSNISLLNKETVEKALCYFEKDYDAFQFTVPDISNWRYQEIDKRELQFFNTFIGVASRFYEVHKLSGDLNRNVDSLNEKLGSCEVDLQALKEERDAQVKKKSFSEVLKNKRWLSAKEAECQEVTRERDAQVKEKEEFQRSIEEQKQWLSAKEAECQEVTRERDAQVKEKRVSAKY